MAAQSTTKVLPADDYAQNFVFPKANGSIVPHLLLFVVQILALSSPSFTGRRLLFSVAIIYLAISAGLNRFSDDPGLSQFFSLAWPHYLSVLEKLLFSRGIEPEAHFWRVDRQKAEARNYTPFGFKKIMWALVIWFNLRGIRWNFEVKNIPKFSRPGLSKWCFLFWQTLAMARMVFMMDLISQLSLRLFFVADDGSIGTVNSRHLTLSDPSWALSFSKTLVIALMPYFFLNAEYIFGSIFSLLTGISKVEDWPPFFGLISEVTTVRDFWGKFWHQMLRKTVNSYTGAFVDAVGIKRGTNLSSYTQLYLSFLISGIMHSFSIMLMPAPANVPLQERTIGFLYFFMLQAVAITAEDLVQFLWKNSEGEQSGDISKARVYIGRLWVVCWFWFSLPFAMEIMLRLKVGMVPPLPFTLVGPLLDWIMSM